jgi:hypothetical protein
MGRNQCTGINLKNQTDSLLFKSSRVRFGGKIPGLTMKPISTLSQADVTTIGVAIDENLQKTPT